MKGERCNCGYFMTHLDIPRAGDARINQEGYNTIEKTTKKGIGFEFAGYKMCPKCYKDFCSYVKVNKNV